MSKYEISEEQLQQLEVFCSRNACEKCPIAVLGCEFTAAGYRESLLRVFKLKEGDNKYDKAEKV